MSDPIIEFSAESEYRAARDKVANYDAAREALYGPNKCAFTYDEIAAIGKPRPTNSEGSAVETWEFRHGKQDRVFAYVSSDGRRITTWTGQTLGTITATGKPYRCTFGDTRVSLRVKGINGVLYSGTYYQSAGDYCRLKSIKAKTETPEQAGKRIGSAIARDVIAQDMPREWTSLDPQDYDTIPANFGPRHTERVIKAAHKAYARIMRNV